MTSQTAAITGNLTSIGIAAATDADIISIDDCTTFIDQNIGVQGPPFSTAPSSSLCVAAVPEPSTIALLAYGTLLLPRRRRYDSRR